MAYKYVSGKFASTAQIWHDTIRQLLLDAGWVQHDQVAATYTIMKSDGSAANGRFMYLKILMTASNMTLHTNWNATSHTSVGGSTTVGTATTVWGGSTLIYAYANKDGIIGWATSAGTLLATSLFACLQPETMDAAAFHVSTTAQATGTAGAVTLAVQSSANFLVGARYCLVDTENGKRAPLLCTAIPDSTHITVTGLTNGVVYSNGSYVGTTPYPVLTYANAWQSVQMASPSVAAGNIASTGGGHIIRIAFTPTAVGGAYMAAIAVPMLGSVVGDKRIFDLDLTDGYAFSPWGAFLMGTSILAKAMQLWSTAYLGCATSFAVGDVQAFGAQVSSTSTGSNTATTFNDTSKAWTVDQWAGKVLVCTAGPESGQITKIISNTATQLIIDSLAVVPTTNTYIIADSAYRVVFESTFTGQAGTLLFREGV